MAELESDNCTVPAAALPPRLAQRIAAWTRPRAFCIGRQRWNHLLFAHWAIDAAQVQATLPRGLFVDTFEGAAFIGIVPFAMERVRLAGLPPWPWLSWFLELNVRTYVHDANGQPGVWFYSLDCNQPLAVALARRCFHLPYQHARMSRHTQDQTISLTSQRRTPAAPVAHFAWVPGSSAAGARPGSLDFFLIERYVLFAADRSGQLFHGRVHHDRYRLHTPVVSELSCEPARQAGFNLTGEPVSVRGALPVDASIFPLRRWMSSAPTRNSPGPKDAAESVTHQGTPGLETRGRGPRDRRQRMLGPSVADFGPTGASLPPLRFAMDRHTVPMNLPQDLTRRDFIQSSGKGAAALVAASLTFPSILRAAAATGDPVRVGHIGIGTRGSDLIEYTGKIEACRVVAVCDVYQPHLQNGIRLSNNPAVNSYRNYHDVLNDPQVEAVIIATPDHWHEQMLLDAVAAGKDVYCEKGWTMSVAAAKRMRAAVKQRKAVMQLGHQGRQLPSADVARKMILDGAIGDITLVNVGRFFNATPERAPWRWYGGYGIYARPDPAQVIKDLDWKEWLGAAPTIDFNERHFWHWRCYWPYGTGQAGDLLSHEMDFVQSVLRYGIPDTCVSSGLNAFWDDDRETPDTWTSAYVFEQQRCTVTFEGSMNSNRKQTPEFIGRAGRLIFNEIGQDASMFETYGDEPAYRPSRYPQPKPTHFFAPTREHRKPSHMENFLQCVRTREAPWCNEDEAFVEAVTLLMSVESYRQKRQVRWDPVQEEIV